MKPTKKNFGSNIRISHSSSIDYNLDRLGINFSRPNSTIINSESTAPLHASIGGAFQTSEQIQQEIAKKSSEVRNDNNTNQPISSFNNPSSSLSTNTVKGNNNNTISKIDSTSRHNDPIIILWQDANEKINGFQGEIKKFRGDIRDIKANSIKVKGLIHQQKSKIESFDTMISVAESKIDSRVKDFEAEVINARNSILAVIALFASFFTFISISVNIFSKDLQLSSALSIILLLWSCTLSFIFVFMAGISKGGSYFTSSSFLKHAAFMLLLFLFCFVTPKFLFSLLGIH